MNLENLVEYVLQNYKGLKILDASSSDGYLSYLLAQKGVETLPVYDPDFISENKEKKFGPIITSSILIYAPYFNVVILGEVTLEQIQIVYRKLKPGTSLIVADNNSWSVYSHRYFR